MTCWSQELYIQAWNFACAAHQGQLVPGTALAYVNHVGLGGHGGDGGPCCR